MITPWRGRAIIECTSPKCKIDPVKENVTVDCLDCELSKNTVIDLNEKPIGQLKKKVAKNLSLGEEAAKS